MNLYEYRLTAFTNRMLRRIFGPNNNEAVSKGWRQLHNEKLYNLHSSRNIIGVVKSRRMGWAGHEACVTNTYKILVGNPDRKRSLGRPTSR
jgi:hypothetical protein